jgi:uncharacterized protein (DUF427 family)
LIEKLKENISLQLKNNSSYFGFIHNTKFPIIMIAKWNGQALAESNDTVVVEGNHYFPKESINKELHIQHAPGRVKHLIIPLKLMVK